MLTEDFMQKSKTLLALLVLMGLRILGQFGSSIARATLDYPNSWFYLLSSALYLVSFFGILAKKRWGLQLLIAVAVIYVLFGFITGFFLGGGLGAFGGFIFEILFLILTINVYKNPKLSFK